MSPKTSVQALKIFSGNSDAFPDKSGPTEPMRNGRKGLVPEDIVCRRFLRRNVHIQ